MAETKNLGRVVGKSAYEIAVENGYIGTEQEWAVYMQANAETAHTAGIEARASADEAAKSKSDTATMLSSAQTAESNVKASETAASNSANEATQSARNAGTSAENAALSETNAKGFSDAAANSATQAAASATAARADADRAKQVIDGFTVPPASKTQLGGVKIGDGLSATADGTISVSNNGRYEFIEGFAVGYDTLYEKPADWDTNFSIYYKANHYGYVEPLSAPETWVSGHFFKKKSTSETVSEVLRSAEPDGTPYSFIAVQTFAHVKMINSSDKMYFSVIGRWSSLAVMPLPYDKLPYDGYNYPHHLGCTTEPVYGYYRALGYSGSQGGETRVFAPNPGVDLPSTNELIKKVRFHQYKSDIPEGTYFEIWAVRA